MKLGLQPKYPRPLSLLRDIAIVRQSVPMDAEPTFEWSSSFKGVPNLRMSAVTRNMKWRLDLYVGHFYRVQIDGRDGEVWRNMPGLLGYLHRHLNITTTETDAENGIN